MKRGFFLLLVVIAIGAVGLLFYPGSSSQRIQIDVSSGATAYGVMEELLLKNVLVSRYPFLVWTKLRKAGSKIKVGRYEFPKGRSAFWIVDDLAKGKTKKAKFVIPEGFASWQIAERIDEMGISQGKEFLSFIQEKKMEGYMYPATYELDYGLSPAALVRIFKEKFDQQWTSEYDARIKERGWTQHQAVTMASIIEREIKRRDELGQVSALYNNRLRIGMKLEADPTVQYGLGYWKSRLLYSDYRNTKSPYNTYLHKGLPPGPICSPGIDAIHAALWPAQTAYIYMVAKEDGYHDFSKTHREHINKVNRRNQRRRIEKIKKKNVDS